MYYIRSWYIHTGSTSVRQNGEENMVRVVDNKYNKPTCKKKCFMQDLKCKRGLNHSYC